MKKVFFLLLSIIVPWGLVLMMLVITACGFQLDKPFYKDAEERRKEFEETRTKEPPYDWKSFGDYWQSAEPSSKEVLRTSGNQILPALTENAFVYVDEVDDRQEIFLKTLNDEEPWAKGVQLTRRGQNTDHDNSKIAVLRFKNNIVAWLEMSNQSQNTNTTLYWLNTYEKQIRKVKTFSVSYTGKEKQIPFYLENASIYWVEASQQVFAYDLKTQVTEKLEGIQTRYFNIHAQWLVYLQNNKVYAKNLLLKESAPIVASPANAMTMNSMPMIHDQFVYWVDNRFRTLRIYRVNLDTLSWTGFPEEEEFLILNQAPYDSESFSLMGVYENLFYIHEYGYGRIYVLNLDTTTKHYFTPTDRDFSVFSIYKNKILLSKNITDSHNNNDLFLMEIPR